MLGLGPDAAGDHAIDIFQRARPEPDVMYVDMAVSVLNAVLAYLFIFGKGPIPQMGIRGAAAATVTANVVACIAFAVMIWRTNKAEGYPFRAQCRLDGELIRRMLRFGLPNGIRCWSISPGI